MDHNKVKTFKMINNNNFLITGSKLLVSNQIFLFCFSSIYTGDYICGSDLPKCDINGKCNLTNQNVPSCECNKGFHGDGQQCQGLFFKA